MKFLLDHYLAPKQARALHSLVEPEHELIHLRNQFSPKTSDEEWVNALRSESNSILISGNVRIVTHRTERQAWRTTGLMIFFLHPGWARMHLFEQHALLSRSWPEILKRAEQAKPGAGFLVFTNRKIKQLY